MIWCRDFFPQRGEVLDRLFGSAEEETFKDALDAANAWITETGADVINVETVVLPNIWRSGERGSFDPELVSGSISSWFQVIRVWYRQPG